MAVAQERTLGELRTELRTRLGFVTAAGNTLLQPKLLDAWLQDAQADLWDQFDFMRLRKELIVQPATFTQLPGLNYTATNAMVAGQILYDPPDDCDPDQVEAVSLQSFGLWDDLDQGIEFDRDTFQADRTIPRQFDWVGDQLQFYPSPDQSYAYKLEYIARPGPFTLNNHRASIDDRCILLQALVYGKQHYNRKFDVEEARLTRRLDKKRSNAHRQQKYNRLHRKRYTTADPYLRLPRMV